jgi:DNA polymerase-1
MSNSKNNSQKSQRLFLLDGNALVHRAFHALPPFTTRDGTPSGAVYGFALTLLAILENHQPDYLAASFDLEGPTFRHEKFRDYKAQRVKAPDELYAQIPLVKKMLTDLGVPIWERQGYEADDVLGSIVKNLDEGLKKVVVTGDRDLFQLADEDTQVLLVQKGIKDLALYGPKEIEERYQLRVDQLVDYKALRGDASDNIPGVKGIGKKTATKLLQEYGTLKGIYQSLAQVKPAGVQKKLQEGWEQAQMSRELAVVETNLELNFDLEAARMDKFSWAGLADFFSEMGFKSLLERLVKEGKISPEELRAIRQDPSKYQGQGAESGSKEGSDSDSSLELLDKKVRKITQNAEIEELATKLRQKDQVAYCLAFRGEQKASELAGVALSTGEDNYFIAEAQLGKLTSFFKTEKNLKIGHRVKDDLKMFAQEVITDWRPLKEELVDLAGSFRDVGVGAYLLGSSNADNWEKLLFEQLGEFSSGNQNAKGDNKKDKRSGKDLFARTDDSLAKECGRKAAGIYLIFQKQQQEVGQIKQKQAGSEFLKQSLQWLWWEVEVPTKGILAQMELSGVAVDRAPLEEASELAQEKIEQLQERIYQLAGKEFNINSPQQLREVLYEKLKVSTEGIRRGKSGLSTDAEQLAKLREEHEIVPLIEDYRELFKVKTTYADALVKLINPQDGRIHAQFNQTVVATGRLSSSNPNLQNIPQKGRLAKLIRKAFRAREGRRLVSVDYSQIDLRVAAHLSDDPKMKEAFEEDKDIHLSTAAWVARVDPEEVTSEMRRQAKALNFGILYGMGAYGFMRDSGLGREESQRFIDNYLKTFSGLKDYLERIKEGARRDGYVETELGRRRYLPGIEAENAQQRAMAERMAVNLPIQGLAADIMKLAMIKAQKEVIRKFNQATNDPVVELILQVHDELIFEVTKDAREDFSQEIKRCLEETYKLRVPLVAEVKTGSNWTELGG